MPVRLIWSLGELCVGVIAALFLLVQVEVIRVLEAPILPYLGENSPLPLAISQLLTRRRPGVRFMRGDLFAYPYEEADAVILATFAPDPRAVQTLQALGIPPDKIVSLAG